MAPERRNAVELYAVAYHSKELDFFRAKSILQVACSANSISDSAVKSLGPIGEPLRFASKSVF